MVFKFLSKGKKSEFFMEAEPLSHEANPAAKLAEAKKAVETAVEATVTEAKKVAEAKVDDLKDTVAKVADVIEDQVEKSVAQVGKAGKAAKPESAKTKKIKQAKAEAKSEVKPEAKANQVQAAPAPTPNFATDFLMPSATPRRRPGPSMNMFRDMVKDVTPRK